MKLKACGSIRNKVFEMQSIIFQANCFECDGVTMECPRLLIHNPFLNCTWKRVSDHDLEKYYNGEPNLTLIDMMMEYFDSGVDCES